MLPLAQVIEQARGLKTLMVTPWMEPIIQDSPKFSYAFMIVLA